MRNCSGVWIYSIIIAGVLISSCSKENSPDPPTINLPAISTTLISSVTTSSATSGGTISPDESASIMMRGIVWHTSPNPTISLTTKTEDGSGTGGFTSSMSGLDGAVKYYVRAYATNSAGTGYGNELSFTTLLGQIPTGTTYSATDRTLYGAILHGAVNANNLLTEVSFEYGTTVSYGNTVPAIQNTVEGSENTLVNATISGLSVGTTYHFRIKAVNSLGTKYGNDESFVSLVNDVDGNIYNTVTIGNQVWMAENLKTTRYNDGTAIPLVTGDSEWADLLTPGYTWYENDIKYANTYGALYNYYVINHFVEKNVCPSGWKVPGASDWNNLKRYLESNGFSYDNGAGQQAKIAKSLSSDSLWQSSAITGTPGNEQVSNNRSGFMAYPGGIRYINPSANTKSPFLSMGYLTRWWDSSPSTEPGKSWVAYLSNNSPFLEFNSFNRSSGSSVRCVRD